MNIVAKFGGSSLADAKCFENVAKIVRSNPDRRCIVVSAPGKRHADDKKITDLLYAWHNLQGLGVSCENIQEVVRDRYATIVKDLGCRSISIFISE